MSTTLTPATLTTAVSPCRPTSPTIGPECRLCDGSGWADPWEVHDGAPLLTWCDGCLGAGLEACDRCDGDGVVPEPTPCPCEIGELDGVPLAA